MNFSLAIAPEKEHPEARLVRCCARMQMSAEWEKALRQTLLLPIDWPLLTQIALCQGMMPLLYRNLKATCPEAVPPACLRSLQQHFQANALHSLPYAQELLHLLRQLDASQVRAIPYKGPMLAAKVYHNLSLREFCDLDILVHEQDAAKAIALLQNEGYDCTTASAWEQNFCHYTRKVNVDLHWGITQPYLAFPIEFDHLWQRRETVLMSGAEVPSLSAEDLLIVLVVQVAKDGWCRQSQLIKVCDVAELIHSRPELNWDWVMAEARRKGSLRILFLGLLIATEVLGAPLPPEIAMQVRADATIRGLAARIQQQLFEARWLTSMASKGILQVLKDRADTAVFPLQMRERWQDQVPYLLHGLKTLVAQRD